MWARGELLIGTTRSTTSIPLQHESLTSRTQASWWEPWNLFSSVGGWGLKNNGFSVYAQERSCLHSPPKIREEREEKTFCCFPMKMERMLGFTLTIWIVNQISPGVSQPRVFHLQRSLASHLFIDIFLGANLGAYLRMFGLGRDKKVLLSFQIRAISCIIRETNGSRSNPYGMWKCVQGKWKPIFSIFVSFTFLCLGRLRLFMTALRNPGKFYFPTMM